LLLYSPNTLVDNEVNTNDVFRPINYLGSKLRILDFIEETVNRIDPGFGRVCDLFSGSGSVALKLSKYRPVTAVDIQRYSGIICSALLSPVRIENKFLTDFIENATKSALYKKITVISEPLIAYEEKAITMALINLNPENLCNVIENGSLRSYELTAAEMAKSEFFDLLKDVTQVLKSENLDNEKTLALRYFGGIYFSYKQAIQIDALLEQVENVPSKFRDTLMAAILSTVSECVNTVGKQFAQPLRPRNLAGEIKPSLGKAANKDRSINLLATFVKWVNKYQQIPVSSQDHQVMNMDFEEALNKLDKGTKVVYADPPYTREHYSRFYHVLETLSKRDLPTISTMVAGGQKVLSRGLYREDRHQSPFCIRSQAPKAFESMFYKVSNIGAKLVLSYSPYDETKGSHPRVITIERLVSLAKVYFALVEVVSAGHFIHSKLTHSKKHLEASETAEVLIICSN